MIAESYDIAVNTRGDDHILDLTDEIRDVVTRSGVVTGQLVAMVVGSTASLTTLEYEPGLVRHDLAAALEVFAPRDGVYEHEKTWHDDNGHSHVRAAVVGPSLALPIVNGAVPLGTWQQVVLVDFDTGPRSRSVIVNVVGVTGSR
ncbi:MAG: secondary thiamine-phosphate synthase enzyme YjbQ [Gemmatimonadota bacterium]|jgi:secondary thiamine-phosphate synthase enzyme